MALVTLVTLVAALSPGAPMHSSNQAQPAISRRNFLPLGAAAGLSLAAMPAFAEDDAIAAIAARANAKAAAEREAKKPQPVREAGEGADLVGAVLIGGTALSVPFFFKNLQRLGIKIASGGKDDGRGTIR